MHVLFLVPYPLKESPSQRFRFEQYFDILIQNGYTYHVESFLNTQRWRTFSDGGGILTRLRMLATGFIRRIMMLRNLSRYDIVFIHREAAPVGPPIFEWIISKVYKKRVIFDFDDAIWMTDRQAEPPLFRWLKSRRKIEQICRWSSKVSCGNEFLRTYALQFNKFAFLNPTTIDTDYLHVPLKDACKKNGEIVIGWTGSSSTLKYLTMHEHILQRIENTFPNVRFCVIADKRPPLALTRLDFKVWNPESEISDLRGIDIGIMPLADDEWSKGKCGFKLLQYMSLEIPAIASRVGANIDILDHGVNGFLVSSEAEWLKYCSLLIEDAKLRALFGSNGRRKVIDHYSVRSNASRFLSLFT